MFMVRGDRSPQGRRPLVAERAAFLALLAAGVSSKRACAEVGVNIRTGARWRNGRKPSGDHAGAPPITVVVPRHDHRVSTECAARPSWHLQENDRILIADLLRDNASIRAIARTLGRPASTVSREIGRNSDPETGQYHPFAAQRLTLARRPRPKSGKIADNTDLRDAIQAGLDIKWSPQQIAARLHKDYPGLPRMHVVHETIYQALYLQGRGELRREVAAALRTGRARRVPHREPGQRQPRFTHPMVMISDRPAEIEDRAVAGHWEGDLIIGKDGASAIATLVERHTRYVLLAHLPHGRTAEHVRDALITTLQTLPQHLTRSLTWDQGSEMACHNEFTIATNIDVYFCNPHSPWERGTNENTNGLLRQYFPKSTDLTIHTAEHLATTAAELNGRPRKTLDWDTPAERLTTLLNNTPVLH